MRYPIGRHFESPSLFSTPYIYITSVIKFSSFKNHNPVFLVLLFGIPEVSRSPSRDVQATEDLHDDVLADLIIHIQEGSSWAWCPTKCAFGTSYQWRDQNPHVNGVNKWVTEVRTPISGVIT